MRSRRQDTIVSRSYRPAPDDCARALLTLLQKPVIKEVGRPAPEPTDRDAERNRSDGATSILP